MARVRGNDISIAQKPLENSAIITEFSKFLLETFPPENGEGRKTWFFRLSLAVGIKSNRLKDLFYDRRCQMRAVELATFQQKWSVLLEQQITALKRRQSVLSARLESIGELDENNPHHRRAPVARPRARRAVSGLAVHRSGRGAT